MLKNYLSTSYENVIIFIIRTYICRRMDIYATKCVIVVRRNEGIRSSVKLSRKEKTQINEKKKHIITYISVVYRLSNSPK